MREHQTSACRASRVCAFYPATTKESAQRKLKLQATLEMQEMNQQFNLQYLNLQQDMQQENRKFTAISNVMKTKHDTAKSMIQNVR